MTQLVQDDDIFHVWQPGAVQILEKGEDGDKWGIGGYSSTDALDRQGEEVLQKGLDFSEFVQHGYYNDNHQQHTSAVVGVPVLAEFHPGKGWWTEGYLLKGVKRAQEIYQLAKALIDTPRELGFSIEGKILERIGNKIAKAIIRNIAITNAPVNPECTWSLLAKSFVSPTEKALSAGHSRTAESGGRVLIPEDLEKDELKYVFWCPHCPKTARKAFTSTQGLEGHVTRFHNELQPIDGKYYPSIRRSEQPLTRSDAMKYIQQLRPGYSQEICERLLDHATQTH